MCKIQILYQTDMMTGLNSKEELSNHQSNSWARKAGFCRCLQLTTVIKKSENYYRFSKPLIQLFINSYGANCKKEIISQTNKSPEYENTLKTKKGRKRKMGQ